MNYNEYKRDNIILYSGAFSPSFSFYSIERLDDEYETIDLRNLKTKEIICGMTESDNDTDITDNKLLRILYEI